VNLDEEKWESEARKKERAALRARIERTRGGYEWTSRIDAITAKSFGKDNSYSSGEDEQEES